MLCFCSNNLIFSRSKRLTFHHLGCAYPLVAALGLDTAQRPLDKRTGPDPEHCPTKQSNYPASK